MNACMFCGEPIPHRPGRGLQPTLCSAECRKRRKLELQRQRLRRDPEFRARRAKAVKDWKAANPDRVRDHNRQAKRRYRAKRRAREVIAGPNSHAWAFVTGKLMPARADP